MQPMGNICGFNIGYLIFSGGEGSNYYGFWFFPIFKAIPLDLGLFPLLNGIPLDFVFFPI